MARAPGDLTRRQLRRFVSDLESTFKKLQEKRELLVLGNEAIRIIKKRTRDGRGLAKPGGVPRPLKKLSKNYIKQRRRMRLSPFTSPTKSNLTRSGRMLASLRTTIQGNRVVVKPTGVSREGIKNEKIAEYVADQGRPFLNLSALETQKLLKEYQKALDRGLKKLD